MTVRIPAKKYIYAFVNDPNRKHTSVFDWLEPYGGVYDSSFIDGRIISHIEFANDADSTIFLMKWSGK